MSAKKLLIAIKWFVNLTYGYMITDDVHLDCEDATQINNQNYEFLNYKTVARIISRSLYYGF